MSSFSDWLSFDPLSRCASRVSSVILSLLHGEERGRGGEGGKEEGRGRGGEEGGEKVEMGKRMGGTEALAGGGGEGRES